MFKKILAIGVVLFSMNVANADNLLQIYQEALNFNPTYLGTKATSQMAKDQIAIARAPLLPQLNANGNYQYNKAFGDQGYTSNGLGFGLTLSQTLFDFSKLKVIDSAKAAAIAASLSTKAAQQDLMAGVASAYFNLAQAKTTLQLDLKKKQDQSQLYKEAEKRFKAGQTMRTSVMDAKAAYAATQAQITFDKANLEKQESIIQKITGIQPKEIAEAKNNIPIFQPNPDNLQKWLDKARLNNLSVQSARYTLLASSDAIKTAKAMHLPTLQATATYNSEHVYTQTILPNTPQSGLTAGLNLNFPIFSGGEMLANTKKSEDQYTQTYQQLRDTLQKTYDQVRQNYITLKSSASLLKNIKISMKLQRQALHDTTISYKAGFQSMQDVLSAQAKLYDEQKNYYSQIYTYLNAYLAFKQAIGTLQITDIKHINDWLIYNVSVRPH